MEIRWGFLLKTQPIVIATESKDGDHNKLIIINKEKPGARMLIWRRLSKDWVHLYCLLFETGSWYVAKAGLELLVSSNPPASVSQVAGFTVSSRKDYWKLTRVLLPLFLTSPRRSPLIKSAAVVTTDLASLCAQHCSKHFGHVDSPLPQTWLSGGHSYLFIRETHKGEKLLKVFWFLRLVILRIGEKNNEGREDRIHSLW